MQLQYKGSNLLEVFWQGGTTIHGCGKSCYFWFYAIQLQSLYEKFPWRAPDPEVAKYIE